MNKSIILILILAGILSGCSQRSLHSGSVYGSEEMGSPTYFKKGIILSVRDVVIKDNELRYIPGVGAAAGAATGGLVGSTLGGNTATRALGGFGGAVIGGIVGHKAENIITGGDASEFIVQPDKGDPYAIVQINKEELKAGERVLIIESGKLRIVRDKTSKK